MEIVINVSDVLPRIAMVAGIISNKNVMPILDNLYFKAYSNGKIEVMGSNAETWITSQIAATSINLDGKENVSFCIESSLLLQALNNLSQKQLSLVFDESQKILHRNFELNHSDNLFYDMTLSSDGIITALYVDKEKARAVWYRTDSLIDAILKN